MQTFDRICGYWAANLNLLNYKVRGIIQSIAGARAYQ